MTIKRFAIFAGNICAAALVLNLALFIGNGGTLPGWVLWYLGGLAVVSLAGLLARYQA